MTNIPIEQKLQRLQESPAEWEVTSDASLVDAVSCTMHPSDPRGSFPGLPPFQLLSSQEALRLLAKLPSPVATGWCGVAIGVLWSSLVMGATRSRRAKQSTAVLVVLKAVVGGLVLFLAHLLFQRRSLQLKKHCSVMEDVSSAPTGPCRVICNVLTLSNSHAGTHADTPFHFARDPNTLPFDVMQYNGSAIVLDVAPYLSALGTRGITVEVLEAIQQDTVISLGDQWRILFRTNASSGPQEQHSTPPAYFDVDAAKYLASLPNLLMVGIDSMSVDDPNLAPICDGSHGAFFSARVAIVENVVLSDIPFGENCVCAGVVRTVFHPTQAHEDSWGCSVWFSPK